MIKVHQLTFRSHGNTKRMPFENTEQSVVSILILSVLLSCCSHTRTRLDDRDSGSENDFLYFAPQLDAAVVSTCGNGVIEPDELCDDGNSTQGDGCSSDCQTVDLCPGGVLEGDYEYPNRSGFDLSYLSECTRITGNMTLTTNTLDNVDPLDALQSIGGHLTISELGLRSEHGQYRTSLEGFSHLESIGGNLKIKETAISDLHGFERLTAIGGDFMVLDNEYFISFEGMNSLTTIGGDLSIYGNEPSRTSEFLAESIEGLEDLEGLNSLKSIGGSLSLSGEKLYNIEALRKLESVGDSVAIQSIAATNLDVLSNLKSVGDFLYIGYNSKLERLFVPNSVQAIGGPVAVEKNKLLPTCVVQSFEGALRQIGFSNEFWGCENNEDSCGIQSCPEAYPWRLDPSDFQGGND